MYLLLASVVAIAAGVVVGIEEAGAYTTTFVKGSLVNAELDAPLDLAALLTPNAYTALRARDKLHGVNISSPIPDVVYAESTENPHMRVEGEKFPENEIRLCFPSGFFGTALGDNKKMPGCEVVPDEDISCRRVSDCEHADALLYHMPEWSGQIGPPAVNPASKKKQVRMAFSLESNVNYPRQAFEQVQKVGFEGTTLTEWESDVPQLYFTRKSLQTIAANNNLPGFKDRKPRVAFVASNCAQHRAQMISDLAKLGVPIDSLGGCQPQGTDGSVQIGRGKKPAMEIARDYRVYISFENSVQKGYVTEKILNAFAGGAVPVYYGAPDVGNHIPPESALLHKAGKDIRGLADEIKSILMDESRWDHYMGWKKTVNQWGQNISWTDIDVHCRQCRYVHALKNELHFDHATQSVVPGPKGGDSNSGGKFTPVSAPRVGWMGTRLVR